MNSIHSMSSNMHARRSVSALVLALCCGSACNVTVGIIDSGN
jgi:hypothetical protein